MIFQPGIDNGCSATVALIVKSKLYVASVGDSKCIISINGDAYEMSVDHTPINELELKRILTAGGIISQNGQINHGLNMSRALGKHYNNRVDWRFFLLPGENKSNTPHEP